MASYVVTVVAATGSDNKSHRENLQQPILRIELRRLKFLLLELLTGAIVLFGAVFVKKIGVHEMKS